MSRYLAWFHPTSDTICYVVLSYYYTITYVFTRTFPVFLNHFYPLQRKGFKGLPYGEARTAQIASE